MHPKDLAKSCLFNELTSNRNNGLGEVDSVSRIISFRQSPAFLYESVRQRILSSSACL